MKSGGNIKLPEILERQKTKPKTGKDSGFSFDFGTKSKMRYAIGIDPGINNGFAVYDMEAKELNTCTSLELHELFEILKAYKSNCEVFIEDPNTYRKFSQTTSDENQSRLQGAGAVKQTYKHIVEFLIANSFKYKSTKIQGTKKKVKPEFFAKMTGYIKRTNEHGRDAAMICFNR